MSVRREGQTDGTDNSSTEERMHAVHCLRLVYCIERSACNRHGAAIDASHDTTLSLLCATHMDRLSTRVLCRPQYIGLVRPLDLQSCVAPISLESCDGLVTFPNHMAPTNVLP